MALIRESGHKAGTGNPKKEILEKMKEIDFHVFNKYAKKFLLNIKQMF